VLAALEHAIGPDDVVIVDAGNTGASAAHHLRAPKHGSWLLAMGMAGMGYAFGAAIGAAFASGKRCWVIAGDGAFYMHGLEVHTAVEHQLPITYVILNNAAHGMCVVRERLLLHQNAGYNVFRRSHIAAGLASMFPGLRGRDCDDAAELEAALRAAGDQPGPSVIGIELDEIEVPPFVAFQQLDPGAATVSRGADV
jgi:acetolactate synthase-1/2/3 large subunit